ncbi:MAG: SAM-dependent methyltransferase, partial [Pseudomonadota bacterium]
GFVPAGTAAGRRDLAGVAQVRATLICYESPRRAAETLADMADALGPERPAALARELTKRFEEVRRAPLAELAEHAARTPPRGEVVLLAGPAPNAAADAEEVDALLVDALRSQGVRDAAAQVAEATGRPRREVYARALEMRGEGR